MNRARRRGIENEQKGPSCLDRNAKIIGRALSTGLQETMTGGGPRMSPHPSIVLVLLKDTVQRYHDTVEDKRGTTLSRARIVSQDFPRKCSCIFQTIPRNNPFHWEATSRILRLLGRNLGQFADVTYLTILEIVSINRPTRISDNFYGHFPSCFFLVSLFITCVLRERIV